MHVNARVLSFCLIALVLSVWSSPSRAAHGGARLPIGSFTASRMDAPTLDGKVTEGEWDRALITSGLMTPFGQELQHAKTTIGFGFDDERFFFLVRCMRGDREWKLWKRVRENDDYNFGDPSIEIWVTPPTLVPETYQNVINTYPAVLDQKMIPTRGYTAQGWKGQWELGVTESETEYIIEAAVPIRDFGFQKVEDGDVWRFLFCRTSPGTKPRAQASWSLTQGFAELNQHPPVRLKHDETVIQVRNVSSLLSGNYDLPITVVAPRTSAASIELALRWHEGPEPKGGDVETKKVELQAGGRETIHYKGTRKGKGNLTVTAAKADGSLLFRQSFPYKVSGWAPQKPVRPEKAKAAPELDVMAKYGPESNVIILRADIIDLVGVDQLKRMRLVAVRDGEEIPIDPSAPTVTREVENQVDFKGNGTGAGLELSVEGRVEFDGYVLNDLTIAPAGESAKVDKLYLEVVLPEREATHFCTMAGGWAAVHDRTPEYWSSQRTASGMLIGDFVPYIWLTNSDRGFLWVAAPPRARAGS